MTGAAAKQVRIRALLSPPLWTSVHMIGQLLPPLASDLLPEELAFHRCDKILKNNNVKEERLILAHGF